MKYGFIDFTGQKWTDVWVNTYNVLTNRIERAQAAGYKAIELLNGRHNFFNSIIMGGQK